jgi:hypothetical protein
VAGSSYRFHCRKQLTAIEVFGEARSVTLKYSEKWWESPFGEILNFCTNRRGIDWFLEQHGVPKQQTNLRGYSNVLNEKETEFLRADSDNRVSLEF